MSTDVSRRDSQGESRDPIPTKPSQVKSSLGYVIHPTSSTSTRAPETMDGPTCEQPADPKLWTVHVHGPDDLITFVDPDVAHALAAQLNALSAEILTDPLDPNVTAHVIPPDNTTDHAQPSDQQSRPVTSVSVREADQQSRPVVSSGSRVGLDLDAIEARTGEQQWRGAMRQEVAALVAEVRRLRDLVDEFRKRDESQDRIRERLTWERDEALAAARVADVPDLMAALRASVEEAKKRRTASDEPARCEHGKTEAHPISCDSICDASGGGSCFTPWCACRCHRGPCRGPDGVS